MANKTILPPRHVCPPFMIPRYMVAVFGITIDAGNTGESRSDSEEMRAATVRPGRAVERMHTDIASMCKTMDENRKGR